MGIGGQFFVHILSKSTKNQPNQSELVNGFVRFSFLDFLFDLKLEVELNNCKT